MNNRATARRKERLDKYFMRNESYAKAVCLKLIKAERAAVKRIIKRQICWVPIGATSDDDFIRRDDLLAALATRVEK